MKKTSAVLAASLLVALLAADAPWDPSMLLSGTPSWQLEELSWQEHSGSGSVHPAPATRSADYILCNETAGVASILPAVITIVSQGDRSMDMELGSEELHVREVSRSTPLENDQHLDQDRQKRRAKHQYSPMAHPGDHLRAMTEAAKASNEKLAAKGLPYRFCVFEKDGRVMIDLVLLDRSGKIVQEVKRDITNEDFDRLIEDVSSIEGLLIDRNG